MYRTFKTVTNMKKSIFLAALVLISAGCFAQKANVSKARGLADAETPDYAGARAAIEEALQNDETKDQANTWYVAGLIGYKEFSANNLKRQMGQNIDIDQWGAAVFESLKYWDKAFELSQIPTYDKKDKAKYDTRTPKNILPKVVEYFQFQPLIAAGFNAYEANNPALAYEMYIAHVNIPELQILQANPAELEKLLRDTSYYTCLYYAGRFAYEAKMYEEALAAFDRMNTELAQKNANREEIITSNEYIYQILMERKDSVTAEKHIKDCVQRFPEDSWFLQNLINLYVYSGREMEAVEILDLAIQREPNVGQYHLSKASIIAVLQGNYEASFACYDKAIELEPNNASFFHSYAIAYSDYATKINNDAAYLPAEEYRVEKAKSDAILAKALPYSLKAYELEPTNDEYKHTLRSIYYRLGMNDKYEALAD